MKSIYLIRHAETQIGDFNFSDIERCLNTNGHIQSFNMSRYFSENIQDSVSLLVSSPAKRAVLTANYFASALKIVSDNIKIHEDLYLPSHHQILKVIQDFDESLSNICIFSHNTGVSDFICSTHNSIIGCYEIPTCGIVKIIFNTNQWKKCSLENSSVEKYWFPSVVLKPNK